MITRKLNWVESTDPNNQSKLAILENQLIEFYSHNTGYYAYNEITANNWIDQSEVGYQEILGLISIESRICEVGCGKSNILKHHPELQSIYSGCDFSDSLMKENRDAYPGANFVSIKDSRHIPFDDAMFDFVFSVFVMEHNTHPAIFLDECSRILKPGGRLIILTPDFLGTGQLTSQRAGLSQGRAIEKFKKGKIVDGFLTLFDTRIRIPFYCKKYARRASQRPLFLVNISPIVFEAYLLPDADAVYLTFKTEIVNYLNDRFVLQINSPSIAAYENGKNIIFISMVKQGMTN